MRNLPSSKRARRVAIVGCVLIAVALLLNQWTVAALLRSSPDKWSNLTLGKIWIFQFAALVVGMALALIPFRANKFGRVVSTLFIGMAITLGMVLLFEGLFAIGGIVILNARRNDPNFPAPYHYRYSLQGGTPVQTIFHPDQVLGHRLAPNLQVRAQRLGTANDVLFAASYSTDANGHRITPIEHPDRREKFILFFSDSFIFGEGVNDDETLPSRVSALAPAYVSYNYGVQGYGPQQMMLQLQSDEITSDVRQKSGILIYLFLKNHINRVIGSMSLYNSGDHMPYYRLEANDALMQYHRQNIQKSPQGALYNILGNSILLKVLNFDLPIIGEQELRTTTRIIQTAREEYKRKFKSDEFYVLLYPGDTDKLIPYLEKAGIKYLDYSKLFVSSMPEYHLYQDFHPSPLAHQTLAEQIVKDLNLH